MLATLTIGAEGEYNLETHMKCLAIDGSTDVSSIALVDETGVLAEYDFAHRMDLSRRLMPNIVCLLKDCGLKVRDIDAVGISLGPGSFTGLRIGVVTAKMLAHVLGVPIAGIVTLDILAHQFDYLDESVVCPLIRVRKGEVYYAFYRVKRGAVERISEYGADSIEQVIGFVKHLDSGTPSAGSNGKQKVFFCGDGLSEHAAALERDLGDLAVPTPTRLSYPKASIIGAIAIERIAAGQIDDARLLTPFYIRRSAPETRMESGKS
ncbi:MAG: tRNA (adenosine(37)-N6)-threonylcarbamoyltransferase complex dimerization subunit type 1 TsaB [Armatimonadetes bacterium]|nr:tRNA (adenosine(37)-N6)-threonylcarbamoyltransferase complex dimerization subunit type 1 TsaB [Armatimonadota bacterium]